MVPPQILQNYPRELGSNLANRDLFPRQSPPLSQTIIDKSIEDAFRRCKKSKVGEELIVSQSPEDLAQLCITHLKQRSDPILSPFFFSQINVEDVFDLDAISHEMQRQRMKIGVFYQYLLIELMRSATVTGTSKIKDTFDGPREGDVVADIETPSFDKGLRLYISVKKSTDTVGGQDFGGAIKRLEDVAKTDKNVTSPYLCVIAIATPTKGKTESYERSRKIRNTKDGRPYSVNCEVWTPGFIFPYITGLTAIEIYKRSMEKVRDFLPFYTLKARTEATTILKERFIKMGISDADGKINQERFFDLVVY